MKHINEFQVEYSNHRIFQSKMSELFTVLYIYSPKISDTYEHSIMIMDFICNFLITEYSNQKPQESSTLYITV